jgi:hypothetical protein
MQATVLVIFLFGTYPWWLAWVYHWHTSLQSTAIWAMLAWASWAGLTATLTFAPETEPLMVRYVALSLTCCAGVSVLGARWPGATAWNFVVLGLLAVLLLPLVETMLLGRQSLDWVRMVFLAGTLAFITVNYFPTCFCMLAMLFAAITGMELRALAQPDWTMPYAEEINLLGLALIPLVGWWIVMFWPRPRLQFDRLWQDFRNRYGLVWAARLQDQFNRAAVHAGWPVHLRWQGLQVRQGGQWPEAAVQEEMLGTLRAMLKRFENPPFQSPPRQQGP